MPETLLTQYLKRGQPDPLADIGQGGPGLYRSPNPIPGEVAAIGEHFVPDYLKNNNVHAIEPNEAGKTPQSQPMNPLPWLGMDIAGNLATGGAKAVAPFMKSMFFGPLAKTANLVKLAKAKEMTAQGAHDILKEFEGKRNPTAEALIPSAIRARDKAAFHETGWLRRPDGKWREYDPATDAHISDIGMNRAAAEEGADLSNILKYKKLYKAYPSIKSINTGEAPEGSGYAGAYNSGENAMWLKRNPNPKRTSTGLHETTHAIQEATGEDFAPGANPIEMRHLGESILRNKGVAFPLKANEEEQLKTVANSLYNRSSGEEEARMAQNMWELGFPLREHSYPGNSLISPSRQVVPGTWLERQTPEIQEYVRNTMTHQFQGGPPTLENYINLLKLDAR